MVENSNNKSSKATFSFDQLNLSKLILSAIKRVNFEYPTEVQSKTIPLILSNKNVVGMARTGSGKTAAYIIPLIEKLKTREPESPFRAICLSPTREIAQQVYQFCTKISLKTSLKVACIIGGTSLNDDYAKLHSKPDVLIGTPGRIAELVLQMDLKFDNLEILAVDEADRMFESGFETHLKMVISKITPSNYQKLLFSATLPKSIMNFIHSDLKNPHFIEIDEGNKLSDNLGTILEKTAPEKAKKTIVDVRSKYSNTVKQALAAKTKLKQQQKEHSVAKKTTSILINYGNRYLKNSKNESTEIQNSLEITDNISKNLFDKNSEDPIFKNNTKKSKVWDRRSKKFISVKEETPQSLFKPTEKSQSYKQWLKKVNSGQTKQILKDAYHDDRPAGTNEIKTAKQIVKERQKKEKNSKFIGKKKPQKEKSKGSKKVAKKSTKGKKITKAKGKSKKGKR